MPRSASPAVRSALVERAAAMLARREPVTLRSLVAGTGASTMAVYTHFDGMPGLWRAVRQEGFTRLATALGQVPSTDDPVRDLAGLGAAYVANAVAQPDLYRAMFDPQADLEDAAAAGASFVAVLDAAGRAYAAGRFTEPGPGELATRFWVCGHGLSALAIAQLVPAVDVPSHGKALVTALLTAAGDEPGRCRASVERAWEGWSAGSG